jgi:hypothetical protein
MGRTEVDARREKSEYRYGGERGVGRESETGDEGRASRRGASQHQVAKKIKIKKT